MPTFCLTFIGCSTMSIRSSIHISVCLKLWNQTNALFFIWRSIFLTTPSPNFLFIYSFKMFVSPLKFLQFCFKTFISSFVLSLFWCVSISNLLISHFWTIGRSASLKLGCSASCSSSSQMSSSLFHLQIFWSLDY